VCKITKNDEQTLQLIDCEKYIKGGNRGQSKEKNIFSKAQHTPFAPSTRKCTHGTLQQLPESDIATPRLPQLWILQGSSSRRNRVVKNVRKAKSPSSRSTKSDPSSSTDPHADTQDLEAAKESLLQSTKPYAEWDILSDELREGLAKLGYTNPTDVQSAAIEPGIAGRDLVVQAKTGTGKTSSFGIPLIEQVTPGGDSPQAIVLAPTRELAKQVAEEMTSLARYKGTNILPVYGGTSMGQQLDALSEGVDIVVGTPGRILDHIKRKSLSTKKIKHVALDEADEMLSMGFFMEVTSIIERCNNRKQMLLFSATLPPDIEGLVRQFTNKPLRLMVSGDDRRVEGIGHHLYFVNEEIPRPRNLLYLIEMENPEAAIIFCNRKSDTAMIAAYLLRQGKKAEALHGDLDQKERERVLNKVKNNDVQYLVATDVASRGIDISGLTHVINYHFPPSTDVYIHRVGRTGRQGRDGTAISLASGTDTFHVMQLKRLHKIFFDVRNIPAAKEVVKVAASRHIGTLFEESLQTVFEPYLPLADGLINDQRGRFVIAHLLKLYHDGEIKHIQQKLEETAPPEPSEQDVAKAKPKQQKAEPSTEKKETKESSNAKDSKESNDSHDSDDKKSDGTTKLYLKNAGSSDDFDDEKVKQLVLETSGVDAASIGEAQIERTYSYLIVNSDVVDAILEAFQKQEDPDSNITVEVAKKRPRRRRRRKD
jgi:ATP-dependent RNA helicase DeaD